MPPPLPPAERARRRAAIKATGGNIAAAARALGIKPHTLVAWASCDRAAPSVEPEKPRIRVAAASPDQPPPPPIRPVYRIAQQRPDGQGKTLVAAIGDAHDSPNLDKARFRWIGRWIADLKPDVVVQIGDFLTLDSLCRYAPNDTLEGKHKPSLKQDLASFKLALGQFSEGLDSYRCERHVCLGNHEDRIWSFTNRTPEVAELLDENIHTILTDHGWTYSPFGALHFVGGAAWTHCPLTVMGKPYGGMYAQNQIARDTLHDVVYGHSHKRVEQTYPKLGHRRITVLNLGCALPEGHVERYAQHSLTGWAFGVCAVTLQHGGIQAAHWVPMAELQERYGP